MISYQQCPVCGSNNIQFSLSANDYTVSKTNFEIWFCNECTLQFTQHIPSQNEIGKYYQSENYVSHSDTKKGLINSLYHKVRKTTLAGKCKLVKEYTALQSGTILDVGCGTGAFLHEMKLQGWQVQGIEPDEIARKNALTLYQINPLEATEFNNLENNKYEAITLWHVLEHIHTLHEYMQKLHQLLTPNGKLFIAVPNYTSKDASIYKEHWAAYDVPRHLYHFSPKSMKQLLQKHGFVLQAIKPMWYDSFYVSMLSEKYKGGNIFKAFINGLKSNIAANKITEHCSSVIYVIGK